MPRSDPTSLRIEVIEGPSKGFVLQLEGRELPYSSGRGGTVGFGRTQRTRLTFYPGNRKASQQIIGPILKPTTFDGIWKERYIGEDRPIDLVELFEDLLNIGAQLRVSWSTIERQGVIKEFDWNPGNPVGGLGDIKWTAVFEWNFDPAKPAGTNVAPGFQSLRDFLVQAANALSELSGAVFRFVDGSKAFVGLLKAPFQSTSQDYEDEVAALILPTRTLVTTAARTGDEPELPARLVEDASTAVGSAQDTAANIAEITAESFPGSVLVQDSLTAVLTEHILRADITDEAFVAMVEMYDRRVQLEEIIRPEEFRVVTAQPGTDLRKLAIQFYGTADNWDRIAKQNGLVSSVIPDGIEEIIIPLILSDSTDPKRSGCTP
jgi:hypothetical protein